jgi:hypothetical protein
MRSAALCVNIGELVGALSGPRRVNRVECGCCGATVNSGWRIGKGGDLADIDKTIYDVQAAAARRACANTFDVLAGLLLTDPADTQSPAQKNEASTFSCKDHPIDMRQQFLLSPGRHCGKNKQLPLESRCT